MINLLYIGSLLGILATSVGIVKYIKKDRQKYPKPSKEELEAASKY